jgi:hypothetical protein
MSLFKRKQKPSVPMVEPSMRLIEDDSDKFDGKTLEDNGQYVVDPATRVTDQADVSTLLDSASPLSAADASVADEPGAPAVALPVGPADAGDQQEDSAVAATTKGGSAEKKEGRFAKLKSRFKRGSAEEAAPAPDADSSSASVEPVDAAGNDAPELADKSAKQGKLKSMSSRSTNRNEKPKFLAVPVRVVIGYLPEVTERDALEYAVGLAEKHFEQIGMSYFDAFKYGNGYAFEAHEGGSGKAYLPEIIRYFDSKGTFRPGEDVKAVIRTATRAVEVQRTREGLAAIILPERDETPPSDWLQPTTNMQPAINKRTGFLVVGAALFTTGFIAMIFTSMLTRFQEYEAAPDPVVQRIDITQLPNQKWSELTRTPADKVVHALRYRNGRWETPELRPVPAAAPATNTATPPPAPGAGSVSAPPPAGAVLPPATVAPAVVPPAPNVGTTPFPSTTNPGATR